MAEAMSVRAIEEALQDFPDPETGRSVMRMDQVSGIDLADGRVKLKLGLTTHSAILWDDTIRGLIDHLQARLPQLRGVDVERIEHRRPPVKIGEIGLTVKSVIAVGSGKGGVGKSTVSAALAYGLRRAGSHVGLMDADVYGPSIPHLVGVNQRPEVADGKMQPIEKDGLKVMSMGFLVPPSEAVVWRGPMLHGATTQFLRDTAWGELDYLIIDMPPGTGDIALTLSQLLPLTGAVVVCTPQELALLDAVKAIAMFRKVHIPLLGMVENMSGFVCPDCGKNYDIFGRGGAEQRAQELQVPFLGAVPINIQVRTSGDAGALNSLFDDPVAGPAFHGLCRQLVRQLANSAREAPPLPRLNILSS
jgi:ATP-binding protein involved in chromosome partitioning